MNSKVDIIGQSIDNVTIPDVVEQLDRAVKESAFFFCITANVDHLMQLKKDLDFKEIYSRADLIVADGVPLLWASKFLGTPLKARVNGTDLFEQIACHAAGRGYSLFLLGGASDTAFQSAKVLSDRHPSLRIAGYYSPAYGFEHDPDQCRQIQQMIRETNADILVVGLGAPKQEKWIASYARETGVAFAVGVGVSFSFVSGAIQRAPRWMQRYGLEWFWRVGFEPRRLWKRYFVNDLPFFFDVALQWVNLRRRLPDADNRAFADNGAAARRPSLVADNLDVKDNQNE